MQQKFIVKEHQQKLLIFFAGWACDETPFKDYRPNNMDYMICYDYRDLYFDYTVFLEYEVVNVVGWSMGVWAAGYVLNHAPKIQGISIAYNGSTFPIDDEFGLPVKIFEGTLQQLTPANLQKFMRRMCGNSAAYKAFMARTPRRDFEEINYELACIQEQYNQALGMTRNEKGEWMEADEDLKEESLTQYYNTFDWIFNIGVIGKDDAIFPAKNLAANLQNSQIITFEKSPHYDQEVFDFLLDDLWKMTYDEVYVLLNKEE